ncbi:MAG: Ni/Fe hydrogenase subunit alpha [Chloroflexota bacterium]|jgi:NAD-reducing hydrogenase large subunit
MAQKITIEPVTRIEGHAKITVHLDDMGNVERAVLHVNEFRGFEKFCEGRMFFEMPMITPRICGICPVSHHLAAAKACDEIVGAKPPRPAHLLRDLMHQAQVLQSHGMHFFELAGPDLILGFDSDPATRNVVGLIGANKDLAVKAVQLRKFGQEIIKTLGGRKVHPNFAVPGGVNKVLTSAERDQILSGYDQSIETIKIGLSVFKDWASKNMDDINKFGVFPTGYLGLVTEQGSWEVYDGQILLINQFGDQLELFQPQKYLDFISERVENWTYLKFPYYKKLGYPGGVYRVGPLGRLNISKKIDTPLANEELKGFKALNGGKPVENTLYYHYARLIEALAACEKIHVLLDDPDILSNEIINPKHEFTGHGVGVLEAPRGTLIHDYHTNPSGKLEKVNLIVSTGHNNYAMTTAVDSVAKTYIKNGEVREGLLNRIEAAVRAHDPCLSCSTHAIGQMPIQLTILDVDGSVVKEVVRD